MAKLDPDELLEENHRLQQWVHDLQAGMYINCVYCGHRYGPADEVPATMADALKEHIEQCTKHPMSALKAKLDKLEEDKEWWRLCYADVGEKWAKAEGERDKAVGERDKAVELMATYFEDLNVDGKTILDFQAVWIRQARDRIIELEAEKGKDGK